MPDRKTQPSFRQVEKIDLIKPSEYKLKNNIQVHTISGGSQEVVKLDFVFNAGSYFQKKPLTAHFTNLMLSEGTKKYTARQIAETMDFYGCHLLLNADRDSASMSVIVLSKFLEKVLPVLEEVIKNSVFPIREFEVLRQKEYQKYSIEISKVKTLARNKFVNTIYGESHPYGIIANDENYNSLEVSDLSEFFRERYSPRNCRIFMAGNVKDKHIKLLEKHFGDNWSESKDGRKNKEISNPGEAGEYFILKEDAVQSAIRCGKVTINKTHADFPGLNVLNTVLGGYFGSRLMSNIREDKGYTYGVGSVVVSLRKSGFFTVVTEVGSDVAANAIKEIKYEFNKLRTELIPEAELNLVRNYMLGEILNGLDGPFAMAEAYKNLVDLGLGIEYYNRLISTIKNISAKELHKLANKYFDEETMTYVVAGKKYKK